MTFELRKLSDDEKILYNELHAAVSRYRPSTEDENIIMNLMIYSLKNELTLTREETLFLIEKIDTVRHCIYYAAKVDIKSKLVEYINAHKKKHIKTGKKHQEKYLADINLTFVSLLENYFTEHKRFKDVFVNEVKARMGLIYGILKSEFTHVDRALTMLPQSLDYKGIIKGTTRYVHQYTSATLWSEYRNLFEITFITVRNKYDLIYDELPTNSWGNSDYIALLENNYPVFRDKYIKAIRPLWD